MDTQLHTFMDIFGSEFAVDNEMVSLNRIVIPIIQRDYAQGREDDETRRIRERFLDSLYQAIIGTPIKLDFIYGDIDVDGVMTPLDGQQRLTTLFLLHWYAAKKEQLAKEEYGFLTGFSYETRYSARDFCDCFIQYTPTFTERLSDEIIDQPWFPMDWKKDATIQSMLVMIDAIHDRFGAVDGLWKRLKDGAISFYFLPLHDMGLTDELYIKMNSRGKPLTSFEHFKAELEHELIQIDDDLAKRIMYKIDIDWTDLLWQYRGENNIIDDEFLRYFRFICDILCYKKGGTTQGKKFNEFDALKEYFSKDAENVMENIRLFESYFDVWCEVNKECSPGKFMEKFASMEHESGKILLEDEIDLFGDCLESYADVFGNGNREFPLNRIILLYAFMVYLTNKEEISEEQFVRRIRVVHNLTRNSEDEISESESRSAGNRMPAILRQVDAIIITGKMSEKENNFNSFQLKEEKEKLQWVEEHPEYAEQLFVLEDHELLYGQISIVGLEHPENFERFEQLFACDWDLVDRAMMSSGDYTQQEQNQWRYQFGSSGFSTAWKNLFHKSANIGYENTQKVLYKLLTSTEEINDKQLKSIVQTYLKKCESEKLFEWRYYYVKYDDFRPGGYGKYSWKDTKNGRYEMHAMWTKTQWSENSYHPFLFVADPEDIWREWNGHYLDVGDEWIEGNNDAFVFYDMETGEETNRIPIARNEDNIDTENRIVKLKRYLKKYFSQ